MGKSDLGFLTFFVKTMFVLTNSLTYVLLIWNNFIGIIDFHLIYSYNSLLIGINYLNIDFLRFSPMNFGRIPPYFFFNNIFLCGGRWLLKVKILT